MPVENGELQQTPCTKQQEITHLPEGEQPASEEVRPITQTDVLNKNLLTAFLRRINAETNQQQETPTQSTNERNRDD